MLKVQIHKPLTATIRTSFGTLKIELDIVPFRILTNSKLGKISMSGLCAVNRGLRL